MGSTQDRLHTGAERDVVISPHGEKRQIKYGILHSDKQKDRSDVRAWRIRWGEEELAMITIPCLFESKIEKLVTPAEMSVVRDVICGKSNADIAWSRGTSARTVANQLASIYRKLKLTSRQELIALLKCTPSKNARAAGRASLKGNIADVRR
jgi:DNA-binding CsgD family transcriptional regulator